MLRQTTWIVMRKTESGVDYVHFEYAIDNTFSSVQSFPNIYFDEYIGYATQFADLDDAILNLEFAKNGLHKDTSIGVVEVGLTVLGGFVTV